MATEQDKIRQTALQILRANPEGVRYGDLIKKIHSAIGSNKNTISGSIYNLQDTHSKEVHKPSRGLFVFKFTQAENNLKDEEDFASTQISHETAKARRQQESEFYKPFAEWLVQEDICIEAVPMGGSSMRKKWGTPDVVGVYKPGKKALYKFEPEVITAEIKTDPSDPITAYGQASAYRLFSHKVYLVVPATIAEDDKSRVESLCLLAGIGFVLFDLDIVAPSFRIRVQPQRAQPDMFYLNEFLEMLDEKVYETLF